jgi:hypothetical protein
MPVRKLTPAERPAEPDRGYVPVRVPGAGEVMLPADTRFAPVSAALLDRYRDWSGPVRFRLELRRDGTIDIHIREIP